MAKVQNATLAMIISPHLEVMEMSATLWDSLTPSSQMDVDASHLQLNHACTIKIYKMFMTKSAICVPPMILPGGSAHRV